MYFLLLILFFITTPSFSNQTTKNVMNNALESMVSLAPYVSSDYKFNHPENEKEILLYLNRLKSSFETANHLNDMKKKNFSPNYKILKEQLTQSIDSFSHQNKNFARLRLASLTSVCLSCHTQISKDKVSSVIINKSKMGRKSFSNDFEYANFQFLLRNYDKAITFFEKSIEVHLSKRKEYLKVNEILGNSYETFDKTLMDSFKNILVIYTKVLRNPIKAKSFFEEYLNKNIPKYLNIQLKEWNSQLSKWTDNKNLNIHFNNDKELQNYLNDYEKLMTNNSSLSTKDLDVSLLINSGILSNYLYSNQKSELTPNILYWLGITENRIGKNIFYTIGDLYLKECIKGFPKNQIAKKCFYEYKEEITLRYTGSLGTSIPKSKKLELQKLEELITK